MTFFVDPAALVELREAADWYESRSRGLGDVFLSAADHVVNSIQTNLEGGSLMETLDDPHVRRVLLKRFPYAVIYELFKDRVHVLAVAHTSRRPNCWLNRRVDP